MNYLKNINVYRRRFTKFITNLIVNKKILNGNLKKIEDFSKIRKILIIRPNHRLGNTLLFTPVIQEITENFPNAKIDLFVKGEVSKIVFQNYKEVENFIVLPKKHFKKLFNYLKSWFSLLTKNYDLVINIAANSSSGKLATKYAKATYKLYGNEFNNTIQFTESQKHFAKLPVYTLRNYLFNSNHEIYNKPIHELCLRLNKEELEKGKKTLNEIILNDKPTITIFTYATGDKCYCKEWWHEMYSKLIKNFPNYNIIEILPFEKVSQINFEAPTFYSKDIRKIAALISNAEIFIGADSGMMHLASCTKTAVVGLFSTTPLEKYGPFGKNKLGINTNKISIDRNIEIIKEILNFQTI